MYYKIVNNRERKSQSQKRSRANKKENRGGAAYKFLLGRIEKGGMMMGSAYSSAKESAHSIHRASSSKKLTTSVKTTKKLTIMPPPVEIVVGMEFAVDLDNNESKLDNNEQGVREIFY